MILPDIWGKGAMFSFSAANGNKLIENSPEARLCSDSFALKLLTKNKCTLSFGKKDIRDIVFQTVMTDFICAVIKGKDSDCTVTITYSSADTISVCADEKIDINLSFENEINTKKSKKVTVYSDSDECFAFADKSENETYSAVLCYGKNAAERAEEEISKAVMESGEQKLEACLKLPEFRIPNERIEKLYYKCVSVLLGHVNSPEGLIKNSYIGSCADEGRALTAFNSALCTLGLRHISPELSKETLESILASAAADGMISSGIYTTHKTEYICPPVLAWCLWELYQINEDKKMLEDAYAPLKKYLHYIMETRDINKNYLYEWQISEDDEAPGLESTMDNSPRFDDGVILDSVDFTSFVANEAKYMKLIAEEIARHGEALYWNVTFERIRNAVNELLFDEDDKIYYDKAVVSNMFKKIKTSASFMPLFAKVCDNRHAMALLKLLNSDDKFNLKYGIPSVSKDSEEYSYDMCRGPMNIAFNYMISKGLEAYEMHDKANEIKAKSLEAVIKEFEADGVIYEFYSPDGAKRAASLSKKGYSINFSLNQTVKNTRDYALTAAVIIDMLLSKSKKLPAK